MQPGDVQYTYADTSEIEKWVNFKPHVPIDLGIKKFISWYKEFYNYQRINKYPKCFRKVFNDNINANKSNI